MGGGPRAHASLMDVVETLESGAEEPLLLDRAQCEEHLPS